MAQAEARLEEVIALARQERMRLIRAALDRLVGRQRGEDAEMIHAADDHPNAATPGVTRSGAGHIIGQ